MAGTQGRIKEIYHDLPIKYRNCMEVYMIWFHSIWTIMDLHHLFNQMRAKQIFNTRPKKKRYRPTGSFFCRYETWMDVQEPPKALTNQPLRRKNLRLRKKNWAKVIPTKTGTNYHIGVPWGENECLVKQNTEIRSCNLITVNQSFWTEIIKIQGRSGRYSLVTGRFNTEKSGTCDENNY
jgi:hypothetical protein